MTPRPKISAVSPVYQAEKTIGELTDRLSSVLSSVADSYEIILVDDGSRDETWSEVVSAASKNPNVRGLRLSRNFGQHYAITAGLARATGDWVVVLDCDLQDAPEEIPALLEAALAGGFDLVFARRKKRKDALVRRLASRLFYRVFSFLTETNLDASVANFGIYKAKVVEAILSMGDSVRYFPTMSQWVGFRQGYLDVTHAARLDGRSTYDYKKLTALALSNMIAFSNRPLRLTVTLGAGISSLSMAVAVGYLVKYLKGDIVVLGYASLILSIWFLGGVTISLIGVVGLYVGQTFERVKNRPLYVVSEATGDNVKI